MESHDTSVKRKTYRICYLPQRYVVSILIFFGLFVNNLLRASLSVGPQHVLVPLPSSNVKHSCDLNETSAPFTPASGERYNWSAEVRSFIDTGYFWGHLLGGVPGGLLSDRYGARHVINCSILGTIFFYILTPKVLEKTHGDYIGAIAVLALTGFASAMLPPSVSSLITNWAPTRDVGKQSAISFSGALVGIAFNFAVSKLLIDETSWSAIFYIYGALAMCWFAMWYFFGYSRYSQSPFVVLKEYNYLKNDMEGRITPGRKKIPWRQICKSVPMWALVSATFGHYFIWHVMIKRLPLYMQQVPRFSVLHSYMVSAIPYTAASCMTVAAGFLSDFLINRELISTTKARKVFSAAGAFSPGIFFLVATYVGCNRILSVVLFTLGMSFSGGYYAGTRVNCLDLAPNFSGLVMGIINSFGAVAGLTVPPIVDVITKNEQLHEWQIVFWMFCAVLFVTNLVFWIFGSSEVQPWNFAENINGGSTTAEGRNSEKV